MNVIASLFINYIRLCLICTLFLPVMMYKTNHISYNVTWFLYLILTVLIVVFFKTEKLKLFNVTLIVFIMFFIFTAFYRYF